MQATVAAFAAALDELAACACAQHPILCKAKRGSMHLGSWCAFVIVCEDSCTHSQSSLLITAARSLLPSSRHRAAVHYIT